MHKPLKILRVREFTAWHSMGFLRMRTCTSAHASVNKPSLFMCDHSVWARSPPAAGPPAPVWIHLSLVLVRLIRRSWTDSLHKGPVTRAFIVTLMLALSGWQNWFDTLWHPYDFTLIQFNDLMGLEVGWFHSISYISFRDTSWIMEKSYDGLSPSWISNYTHYYVWDKITYPFLNFNGATVEV